MRLMWRIDSSNYLLNYISSNADMIFKVFQLRHSKPYSQQTMKPSGRKRCVESNEAEEIAIGPKHAQNEKYLSSRKSRWREKKGLRGGRLLNWLLGDWAGVVVDRKGLNHNTVSLIPTRGIVHADRIPF